MQYRVQGIPNDDINTQEAYYHVKVNLSEWYGGFLRTGRTPEGQITEKLADPG